MKYRRKLTSILALKYSCGLRTIVLGFVLLDVAPGREGEFFSNLGTVAKVRGVFYLFDEYEFLAEVEGDTTEDAMVASRRVRSLPGVERTAIFIEGAQAPPIERAAFEVPEPSETRNLWR